MYFSKQKISVYDLVNIHLFHDPSNLVALETVKIIQKTNKHYTTIFDPKNASWKIDSIDLQRESKESARVHAESSAEE